MCLVFFRDMFGGGEGMQRKGAFPWFFAVARFFLVFFLVFPPEGGVKFQQVLLEFARSASEISTSTFALLDIVCWRLVGCECRL